MGGKVVSKIICIPDVPGVSRLSSRSRIPRRRRARVNELTRLRRRRRARTNPRDNSRTPDVETRALMFDVIQNFAKHISLNFGAASDTYPPDTVECVKKLTNYIGKI